MGAKVCVLCGVSKLVGSIGSLPVYNARVYYWGVLGI